MSAPLHLSGDWSNVLDVTTDQDSRVSHDFRSRTNLCLLHIIYAFRTFSAPSTMTEEVFTDITSGSYDQSTSFPLPDQNARRCQVDRFYTNLRFDTYCFYLADVESLILLLLPHSHLQMFSGRTQKAADLQSHASRECG